MHEPQKVLVPALVGLGVQDARALARTAEVEVVSGEAEGTLPVRGTVSAQQPGAGTRVEPDTAVEVLVEDDDPGGGRGVPAPPPEPLGPAGAAV